MPAFIGHVDADSFYVSAERVRLPHLHRMPVGVLGNHGACIIAKSYEMKAFGVTTGMPIWEALPICPDGIYIKRDFTWYETLSRKMLAVVKSISPLVEYYSVDEMFFSAEHPSHDLARKLQAKVLSAVGVPVSVGIARTKILAKLASDHHKPLGCFVIGDNETRLALLHDLPVTEITGIARRSAARLASHGITTCEQFVQADRRLIRRILTKRGEDLWWELNGDSVIPIAPTRPRNKFIARGGSLGRATNDPDRLRAFVVRNTERLVEALHFYQLGCDQLILDLSFKPSGGSVSKVNLLATAWRFEEICLAALRLLEQGWASQMVHYMHVIAGGLRDRRHAQRSLFSTADRREEVIDRLKHTVNESFGRFILRSAATLPLADVYGDPANAYDICDIYGKSCF
ncbi:MAG: nucleotidyltransferase [Planctomycetia bacterium]|nr:nucleotidyltransferase [Planctomycetia bacterium]